MSQQPFGDIPLFRELQRLLSSQGGPVNDEIAHQVAASVAGADRHNFDRVTEQRLIDEALHEVEAVLSSYTRLTSDEPMRSSVVTRTEWANKTLTDWRWLLEQLAVRFGEEMGRVGGEEMPEQMGAALGGMAPLLMGIQAGSLVGQLATEALAHHDWPIPRADDERVLFVPSNAREVAERYALDLEAFRRWLALREVSRHLISGSVPWADRYGRSLVTEIVDSIEIDVEGLERRLVDLQTKGMEALQEGLGAEGALPVVQTERHRGALDRLHAFAGLTEGYARHARTQIATQLFAEASKIEEAMVRHDLDARSGEMMLSSVLGITVDRALENTGTNFCAAVVELRGLRSLNQVWDAPDNLPTLPELKDPFAWMERVLDESTG